MTKYEGSCHCQKVRFEVELDLAKGTTRCNCTSCTKRRWWGVMAKPDAFRIVAGEAELVKQKPAKGPGGFCKHCGVYPFAFGDAAEWNDGDYVSINVACLDNLTSDERAAIPIAYLDGLHDTWAPLPDTNNTRYL